MAQNSEQIESKLCAYIEGELDERGRAEIERHLQANPHHRKLLSELGATRRLVQELSRDSAPAELYEMFQSQLERSVLLDFNDGRDEPEVYGRINRFPQAFAAAAIVLLAIGLGTIVYFALPTTGTQRNLALQTESTPPLPPATSPLLMPPDGGTETFSREGLGGRQFGGFPSTSTSTLGGVPSPTAAVPSLPSLADKFRNAAAGDPNAGIFTESAKHNERLAEPLVMIVSAQNPSSAESTLRRALEQIPGVSWTDATASASLALDTTALATTNEEKSQQLSKKVAEFAVASPPASEPATTTRMLKQATDVLKRSELRRSGQEVEHVDKLHEQFAKGEADEATAPVAPLPAEQQGLADATSAPAAAPAPAPAGPASASAPYRYSSAEPAPRRGAKPQDGAPQGAQVALRSAEDRDGHQLLREGDKESAASLSRADRARRAITPDENVALAPMQPDSQSAAKDAVLTTAYRVILARNVPRSQVEALRQQLDVAAPGQRQEQLQQVRLYYGNNPPSTAPDVAKDMSALAQQPSSDAPAPNAARPGPTDAAMAGRIDGAASKTGATARSAGEPTTRGNSFAAPATTGPAGVVAAKQASPSARLNFAKDRTVRSGDTLRLSIAESGKPPVERDVRVAEDGTLALPSSGESVYSEGLTVKELELHLEATIARQKNGTPAAGGGRGGAGGGGAGGFGGASAGARPGLKPAPAQGGAGPTTVAQVSIATVVPTAPASQPVPAPTKPASKPDVRANLATTSPARPPTPSTPVDAVAPAAEPNNLLAERTPATTLAAGADYAATVNGADDTPVEVVFVLRQADGALAAAAAPGAAPTAPPIQDNEILTVTIDDPAGPSTNNVRVAEDGTLDVPQLGKFQALGRTPAQVESEIESRWRRNNANAPSLAKAKVVRPGETTTTAEPPPAAATPAPNPNR